MKTRSKILSLATLALTAVSPALMADAQVMPATPELYVVMFHADWCGPCKIVEPNLDRAMKSLNDPSLEMVWVDVTNGTTQEASAHRVFDRNIVAQYNQWFGTTGFAAIIDGNTKQTLGCVNMTYDAGSMASHITNLKRLAMADQTTVDFTCPSATRG